jgi:hypothetical protein
LIKRDLVVVRQQISGELSSGLGCGGGGECRNYAQKKLLAARFHFVFSYFFNPDMFQLIAD